MSNHEKTVSEVLDLKATEEQMLETHRLLQSFVEKSEKEREVAGTAASETKAAVDKLSEKATELGDRIADIEQRQAARVDEQKAERSPGEMLVESDDFASMMQRKHGSARIEYKTAIVTDYTGGMSQPLVAGDRLNMVWHEPNRILRVRDVLPKGRTTSNVVWYPKESAFTNNAAVVRNTSASPVVQSDNVTKPESAITFSSDSETVKTIAHFIPVSKQALDDSDFLASYVNSRLMYGLMLEEEDQLVNGTGLTGYISGITSNSTAYAQADSPNLYSDSLDYIRDAAAQAQVANYNPSVILMNVRDWSDLELKRESSNGQYIQGSPRGMLSPTLWGMQVVPTNTVTKGTVFVMDPTCFQIFDREDASVEVSYEDSTNFQKNLATIRAEKRLAFVCYSTSGNIELTL